MSPDLCVPDLRLVTSVRLICGRRLLTKHESHELTEDDIGRYYWLNEGRVLEVFDAFYDVEPRSVKPLLAEDGRELLEPEDAKAGCKGLQARVLLRS